VIRTVGEDFEPSGFRRGAPKAIAYRALPDTLRDRSIPIDLRRKLPNEKREKFRYADGAEFADLGNAGSFRAGHADLWPRLVRACRTPS